MKFVSFAIASLTLFILIPGAIAESPPSPARISQTSTKADLPLLAKVIQKFLASDRYATNAEVRVNSVAGNTTVRTLVNVKTLAEHPNKFRSEIRFAKPDQPSRTITTIVISDGQQVWLYRPDLKQYQTMTYGEFDQFEDSFWLGFSTMIYGQIPADVRQAIRQDQATHQQIVEAVGLEIKALQGTAQTMDSRPMYVYQYRDAREGFTFSAFVEPATAAIAQMQIAGQFEGADITIAERILSRTANPAIAPNAFTFSPPPGTQQVKAIAIGPL